MFLPHFLYLLIIINQSICNAEECEWFKWLWCLKSAFFFSVGKTLSNDNCIAFNWMGQDFAEGVCRFDHLHQQAWCPISENTWSYCNSNCTVYNGKMLVNMRFMIIWWKFSIFRLWPFKYGHWYTIWKWC